MSTLRKVERLMEILPNIDFPYACDLLARIERRLGTPIVGSPCLNPGTDGLDCHSRSADPKTWCDTCAAFAVEIGSI